MMSTKTFVSIGLGSIITATVVGALVAGSLGAILGAGVMIMLMAQLSDLRSKMGRRND